MTNVKPGDIVFSTQRNPGFYARGVRFFTKSEWSHCFIIMTDVAGEPAALEADLKCQVVPFNKEYGEKDIDIYEVYRPIKATKEELEASVNRVYREYAGEVYGFLQIPWFMWDAICHRLGWSSGKNWFPNGAICSEVAADHQMNINSEYQQAHSAYSDLNRISPEMLARVVKSRPDLFEFVLERK
jgi:hypothetical protein